jgi:hypothetical protein
MNWDEYNELQEMVLEAKDRLESNTYASGSHYKLMNLLRKYKIFANSREQTVEYGQILCDKFISEQLQNAIYEAQAEAE